MPVALVKNPDWLVDAILPPEFDPAEFSDEFAIAEQSIFAGIRDSDRDASQRYGLLASAIALTSRIPDEIYGGMEAMTASVSVARHINGVDLAEHYLNNLYRGSHLVIRYRDDADNITIEKFRGEVSEPACGKTIDLKATDLRVSVLNDQIPKGTITEDLFPGAPDVGSQLLIIYGHATNIPCYWIRFDLDNSVFYCLAPRAAGGGALTFNLLRRGLTGVKDSEEIAAPEYTILTGLSEYPAWATVISFTKAQVRFGTENARLVITADISTPEIDRNFSRLRRNALSQAWGGGQAVNAASFDAAEALLDPAATQLYADGVLGLDGPVALRDFLDRCGELTAGQSLSLNSAGERVEHVDTEQSAAALELRDGPGDGVRNIVGLTPPTQRSTTEQIKSVTVAYRAGDDGKPTMHITRTCETATPGHGRDLLLDLTHLVAHHVTADRIAYRKSAVIDFTDESFRVIGFSDARAIVLRDLLSVTFLPWKIDGFIGRVSEIVAKLTTFDMLIRGGSLTRYIAIFNYIAGPIPADSPVDPIVDYSNVVPNHATALTITKEDIRRDAAGQDRGYAQLSWTLPPTNRSAGTLLYRAHVTSGPPNPWTALGPVPADQTQAGEVSGLSTTKSYDYGVRVTNQLGTLSTDPSIEGVDLISARPALVDIVAPATATGFTAQADIGQISLKWDKPPEAAASGDYLDTEIHRNTVDVFTDLAGTFLDRVSGTGYVDSRVLIGTPYFYKIRHRDKSKNAAQDANNAGIALSATRTATASGSAQGTTPGTPSAPTHNSGGVYQDAQGGWHAYEIVNIPSMPANAARMQLLAKEHAATEWSAYGAPITAGGGTARLEGGAPNAQYDIALQAFGAFGAPSAISGVLTITAASDTTPPNIPTFVLDGSKLVSLAVRVTSTPPSDHRDYEYQLRSASSSADGAGAGSVLYTGFFDGQATITAKDLPYGTTYHLRIRDKDRSNNPTTGDGTGAKWTATQPFTFTAAGTVDLGDGVVTPPKRTGGAYQLVEYTLTAGARTTKVFVGDFNTVYEVASGHADVFASIAFQTNGTATISLYNVGSGTVNSACTIYFEEGLAAFPAD